MIALPVNDPTGQTRSIQNNRVCLCVCEGETETQEFVYVREHRSIPSQRPAQEIEGKFKLR